MIDWEKVDITSNVSEDGLNMQLGAELKSLYVALILEDEIEEPFPLFQSLVVESVEEISKRSSEKLQDSYSAGWFPMTDDSPEIGRSYINKFVARFREALCSELYDNPDLSSNTRTTIIALIPTIITLLGAAPAYAALAIPISIIVSRIGVKSLCRDFEIERKTKEFIEKRLEIHRENLLFLEQECARYSSGSIPDLLDATVQVEEVKINKLEDDLRLLNK
jgi:hypothetical protein